ncbi:DUF2840 domain-containing protein [Rudaea sp.]|uniref:DUF2840 domain-containing protein n=1 Tax=Rudaea sp. TaxID=2136325 RepID=UPI00378313D7
MSGDGNDTHNVTTSVVAGTEAPLTEVHLEYRSNRRYRLLFGAPFDVIDMDTPRPPGGRIAFFRPGDRFGLVLWDLNDFGTTHWRVLVCRALRAGETGARVPQVQPGAVVLLDVVGATRARAALTWLRPTIDRGDALALPDARFVEADFRLNNTPLVRLKAYAEVQP